MDFWSWIIVFVLTFAVVGIVGVIVNFAVLSNQKNEFLKLIENLDDFESTDVIIGGDGLNGFGFDVGFKKVCLIYYVDNQLTAKVYPCKDILSCELFEDGETVTKTARMNQAGGALIGGLLFGGLGAVVGGLSGKTKTTNLVSRIDLRLIINDPVKPVYDINFLSVETTKTGVIYKSAMESARFWHGKMTVVIKGAESQDEKIVEAGFDDNNESTALLNRTNSPNLIDELTKLGDLLDRGILTNDEFQTQKKRLLAN